MKLLKSNIWWGVGACIVILIWAVFPQLIWLWLGLTMPGSVDAGENEIDLGPQFRIAKGENNREAPYSYVLLWNRSDGLWPDPQVDLMVGLTLFDRQHSSQFVQHFLGSFCDSRSCEPFDPELRVNSETSAISGRSEGNLAELHYFLPECSGVMSISGSLDKIELVARRGEEVYRHAQAICEREMTDQGR